MLSFFEVNDLIQEAFVDNDWQSFFSKPNVGQAAPTDAPVMPQVAPQRPVTPIQPQTAPLASRRRQVLPGEDPLAQLSGLNKLRHRLPNKKGDVITGRDLHGKDVLPTNTTDQQLNNNARQIARGERDSGPGHFNLVRHLTGAYQDKNGRSRPADFLAAKIVKQIEDNPGVFRPGQSYTLRNIYDALGPAIANYDPKQVVASLFNIANLGDLSPFTKQDSVSPDGRKIHSFIFQKPKPLMDLPKTGAQAGRINQNPEEDRAVLGPRQINPARQGGRADKVGYNYQEPEVAPRGHSILGNDSSRDPNQRLDTGTNAGSILPLFQRLKREIDEMMKNGVTDITKAKGIHHKMGELAADARDYVKHAELRDDADPAKIAKDKEIVKDMYSAWQSIPADFGLSAEVTPEYKPATTRRRLPHHQAIQGMQQNRPVQPLIDKGVDDELEAELNAKYGPRREWAYYSV